jgi:thiamine-monophosphate kinase
MLDEQTIIRLMLGAMPDSPTHLTPFFTSDAELLDLDGARLLLTVDSFGAEDHFRTDDLRTLGRNLAACTMSDIFAAGGTVRHMAHSVTVPATWDAPGIRAFADGIAAALAEAGAGFAGGDIGCAADWHYTGVAIGTADRVLTRMGLLPGHALYLTGAVGAGNVEAAAALLPAIPETAALIDDTRAHFPIRRAEAAIITRHAAACIDTSDGLLNALHLLAALNDTGFRVDRVPWLEAGRLLLAALELPLELLAAGECGEYELLCSIPPDREDAFTLEAREAGCTMHRIGEVTAPGTAEIATEGHVFDVRDFRLSARQFADHQRYLAALTGYVASHRYAGE